MSDRVVTRLMRVTAAFAGLLALFGSATAIGVAGLGSWWSSFGGFIALFAFFFAVFVWFVGAHQPRNAVVWIMAVAAVGGGLWLAALGAAALVVRGDPGQIANLFSTSLVPGELERPAAWLKMAGEGFVSAFLFPGLTFGLLLFPDGRLASPRWRWVGATAAGAIVMSVIGSVWAYRPGNTTVATEGFLYGIGTILFGLAIILSLLALVVRFRRSTGTARDQFKWVVWGAATFVPTVVASILLGGSRYEGLGIGMTIAGGIVFVGSYGIAVGRYRLFDVDVVISRTVVIAGLAGFITVVYAIVVGAVGFAVGSGTKATLPLSIAATVVVAIAFQPLRQRMRRVADRLVYGERATPYEVLSRFSRQMRDLVVTEDVIPYLARLIATGTGARRAAVWMRTGNELQPAAVWPAGGESPGTVPLGTELGIPDADHVAPIEHDAELLGAITVTMPAHEALTGTARRLVDDAASQAGLVLRNARLIGELRSSRKRLVAAQDEERRRLERDLHDGAQQQFIAVKMKAALAKQLTDRGDGDRAAELLTQVLSDLDEGVQSLRELAHGIYPPLLEAEGLPAALRSRAGKAPVPVSLTTDGVSRYPPEIEAAVYFCVLEALQNAVKYSEADHVSITLTYQEGELAFRVADDGAGFDPDTHRMGRGLTNMTDRLDALGGTMTVDSTPGEGTAITGVVVTVPSAPKA